MRANGNIGEFYRVDTDFLSITSAAGATGKMLDMQNYDKALFIFSVGTFTLNVATAYIVQSGDEKGSTQAAISGATAAFGNTTALHFNKLNKLLITVSSAATDNDTVQIQGVTLTNSTAGATTTASALGFGSSDGATGSGGTTAIANSLASRINSTAVGLSSIMIATTVANSGVIVQLRENVDTYLGATGHANFPITALNQQVMIEVTVDKMESTARYIAARISTGTTACDVPVTVIRYGSYRPPYVQGIYTKAT